LPAVVNGSIDCKYCEPVVTSLSNTTKPYHNDCGVQSIIWNSMFSSNCYDGCTTPPFVDKRHIQRRKSAPCEYQELLESERDRIRSDGKQLSEEIEQLRFRVEHLKSESPPYQAGEIGGNCEPFIRKDRKPIQQQTFLTETSFVESLNKLSRPKITHLDLPTFDGTGSKSFKTFLKEFEDITNLGKWTEEEKLAALPSILQKRPKIFFHRMNETYKTSFALTIKKIESMFDAPEKKVIRRRKLHSIKQGDSSFLTYLEELEFLFTELKVPENRQLDFLLAELRPDLQDFVCLKQFKTYNDAVKALKLKESLKREKPLELTKIWEKLNAIERMINRKPKSANNNEADIRELISEINLLKYQNGRNENVLLTC